MKKKIILAVSLVLIAVMSLIGFAACNKAKFKIDKNISVVAREDGSGTKASFMEFIGLKGKSDPSGVIVGSSTAAVLVEVKNNPQALGYDSLGYVTDEVKILKVDGVYPSAENIANGTYKIARPLSIVYKTANIQSGAQQAYFEFLQSIEAQDIIKANDYVTDVNNAAAYAAKSGLSGEIKISGSTSLEPLMKKLAAKFEQMQSGVTVTVGGGGSGTGYKDAQGGVSDFGMISERFNQTKAPDCVHSVVALDGIAIIVNKANTIDNITIEALKNIYNAEEAADTKIKTWAQVK